MAKIVFFNIPAHGHTNPTIAVVKELTVLGHEVWYYSFNEFKDKIEQAGAKFISCDGHLPELKPEDENKIGKDFAALIEMVADTTISLDEKVCQELLDFQPDCIVSDSICFWGKLFAQKLNIPYISSTTTFAFNQHTAKMMKQGFGEILRMILGMPRINKKIKLLQENGYAIDSFVSLIENDNNTDTIVYTSKEFQPLAETFSDKYAFIGPSVREVKRPVRDGRQRVYISLGTVLNKNNQFYKNCIEALKELDLDVVISVGEKTDISTLGNIPDNFIIKNQVDQIQVLSNSDVFLTHCGMNSVNESLYYGVPMVLFPQHSEQAMVAERTRVLGAGVKLRSNKPKDIRKAITEVLNNATYRESANKISDSFKAAGGAKKAANVIQQVIKQSM